MMMLTRLLTIGIGPRDVLIYSGHSTKRGSVQLFRSLGIRDEFVMQRDQMIGARAYANYCEAYNDCRPEDLPIFSSAEKYLEHAKHMMEQKEILLDEQAFPNFLSRMTETHCENQLLP